MNLAKKERLTEEIRQKAAEFISEQSNRLSMITVTRAALSPDRRHATIFVTILPEEMEKNALNFLKRQRSGLRDYLLKNIRAMRLPTIDFEIDRGEKNRQRLDTLE